MSSSTVFRVSGIALIIGALFVIAATWLRPDDFLSPLALPTAILSLSGTILALSGLPGLYARLQKRVGILGFVGFVLLFFSTSMEGVGGGMLNLINPYIEQHAPKLLEGNGPPIFSVYFPIAGIMFALGSILFGIMVFRANSMLGMIRWAGILLLVGGVANFIGNFSVDVIGNVGLTLFLAALIWLGYFLVTEQRSEIAQSVIATANA